MYLREYIMEAAGIDRITKTASPAKRNEFANNLWMNLPIKDLYPDLKSAEDLADELTNVLVGNMEDFPDNIRSIDKTWISLAEMDGEMVLVFNNNGKGKECWYLSREDVRDDIRWKKFTDFKAKSKEGFSYSPEKNAWVDPKGNKLSAQGKRNGTMKRTF